MERPNGEAQWRGPMERSRWRYPMVVNKQFVYKSYTGHRDSLYEIYLVASHRYTNTIIRCSERSVPGMVERCLVGKNHWFGSDVWSPGRFLWCWFRVVRVDPDFHRPNGEILRSFLDPPKSAKTGRRSRSTLVGWLSGRYRRNRRFICICVNFHVPNLM